MSVIIKHKLIRYNTVDMASMTPEDAMAQLRMCHICYIGRIPEDVSPYFRDRQ